MERLKNLMMATASVAASLIPVATKTAAQERAGGEAAFQRAYAFARALLMTSGTATPPRPNTVRRMMRLLDRGGPSVRGSLVALPGGGYIHPTKGARRG